MTFLSCGLIFVSCALYLMMALGKKYRKLLFIDFSCVFHSIKSVFGRDESEGKQYLWKAIGCFGQQRRDTHSDRAAAALQAIRVTHQRLCPASECDQWSANASLLINTETDWTIRSFFAFNGNNFSLYNYLHNSPKVLLNLKYVLTFRYDDYIYINLVNRH